MLTSDRAYSQWFRISQGPSVPCTLEQEIFLCPRQQNHRIWSEK